MRDVPAGTRLRLFPASGRPLDFVTTAAVSAGRENRLGAYTGTAEGIAVAGQGWLPIQSAGIPLPSADAPIIAGAASWRGVATTAGVAGTWESVDHVAVTAAETLEYEVAVRSGAASVRPASVWLRYYNAAGVLHAASAAASGSAPVGTSLLLRGTAVVPAGAVTAAVAVSMTPTAGGDVLYWDTVLVGREFAPFVATAPAAAMRDTDEANSTPAGTVLTPVAPLTYVESAVLATPVVGGAGPETPDQWRARAVNVLARLVSTLVLPDHFTARALEDPAVYRATTVDNWNINATAYGHVTVAVLGPGATVVPTADKTALQTAMEAQALANLAVHVVDATLTPVAVTVTVHRLRGFTTAAVVANVTAALAAYLSADAWPFASTVRRFELIATIDRAAGVDYVDTMTTPAADIPLGGVGPLATLGAVAVTVIDPV
jgi:hypothetical protein